MGSRLPAGLIVLSLLGSAPALAETATGTSPSAHVVAPPHAPARQGGPTRHTAAADHAKKSAMKKRAAAVAKAPAAAAGQDIAVAALPLPPTPPSHPPPPPEDPNKGSVTGLPLPRFVALRADDVYFRVGPGARYPIEWLFKRRGLPVEIEREFEVWRLVVAPDGTKGWVHEATLVGHRDFVVTGTSEQIMRREPTDRARPVAVLKPGVLGRIRDCPAGSAWCHVQVGDYRGWLKRDAFWGALPGEVIAPG